MEQNVEYLVWDEITAEKKRRIHKREIGISESEREALQLHHRTEIFDEDILQPASSP